MTLQHTSSSVYCIYTHVPTGLSGCDSSNKFITLQSIMMAIYYVTFFPTEVVSSGLLCYLYFIGYIIQVSRFHNFLKRISRGQPGNSEVTLASSSQQWLTCNQCTSRTLINVITICVSASLLCSPISLSLLCRFNASKTGLSSTRVLSTMKTLSGPIIPLHPWYL